ncbi:MAG TPA: AEC family transporter [Clostridiales bacterium]|nr:AEC family transporter [Clostridiales bacterium]
MDITVVLESIGSLLIMILAGFYAGRRNIITPDVNKGLIDILIHIALPFMILSSFVISYDIAIKSNVAKTFLYSLAAYGIMTAASYLLTAPIKGSRKTVLHFANVFVNTGYIGFPILNSVYGTEGVVYGSIFNIFFVVFVWTYGLLLYKGEPFNVNGNWKGEIGKILLNPSILAVAAGILLLIFNLALPRTLLTAVKGIGNMTGPLSMLIIGAILSKVSFKNFLKDWMVYYGVIIKLVAIPAVIYILALFAGDSSRAVNSVIIMTAMPASAMTSIFAEQFNKEKEFAAVLVSMTTLLSFITSTLLLSIIF